MDSIVFTILYADGTTDTADVTHRTELSTLIMVAAAYEYVLVVGHDIDNASWTSSNALAAYSFSRYP